MPPTLSEHHLWVFSYLPRWKIKAQKDVSAVGWFTPGLFGEEMSVRSKDSRFASRPARPTAPRGGEEKRGQEKEESRWRVFTKFKWKYLLPPKLFLTSCQAMRHFIEKLNSLQKLFPRRYFVSTAEDNKQTLRISVAAISFDGESLGHSSHAMLETPVPSLNRRPLGNYKYCWHSFR